jgi:cytochrome oxidase Cu insertion factor (SCO1/SenC/PrrC family)
MEHSAFVYVIDPAGNYATLFAPRGGQGPDQMAQRLRELIEQSSRH